MKSLRALALLAVGIVFAAAGGDLLAQSYPTKPLRLVVAFPPGGTSDFVERPITVACRLSPAASPTRRYHGVLDHNSARHRHGAWAAGSRTISRCRPFPPRSTART